MKEEGATENSSILQLLPFGNLNIFYAKAICNIFFYHFAIPLYYDKNNL